MKSFSHIRKYILFLALLATAPFFSLHGLHAQSPDTVLSIKIENTAFQWGEELEYRVFYDSWLTSWITSGIGTMKISEDPVMIGGIETHHIEIKGNSVGLFTLFYKVRDKFETFMDTDRLIPLKFKRNTHEGKHKVNDEVVFDHENGFAQSSKMKKEIPAGVQDIISAFYYMRTINFDTAKIGDEYFLHFYLDDSVYSSKIIFGGRAEVRTSMGRIRCMKFKPQVAQGGIFQEPYPMELWVTDDKNKIPVLAKSGVYVGSITIELVEYSGLRHPFGERSDE